MTANVDPELQVPIADVARALGMTVTERSGRHVTTCPSTQHEHDDRQPAVKLGGDANLALCWKCGWSGDTAGLVKAVRACSPAEAFNWICETFNIPARSHQPPPPADPLQQLAQIRGWNIDALRALGAFAENGQGPDRDIDAKLRTAPDAAACALANRDATRLESKPRMADFARFVAAADPVLPWEPGAFEAAYSANREEATATLLDNDGLGSVLLDFATVGPWEGSASELLDRLRQRYERDHGTDSAMPRDWPRNARALSARLKRLAPALRAEGVSVEFVKSNGRRAICLELSL